ncbi:peptidase inhibitor 16 [Oryctolagus cuniculus]|uniref:peptidase inhibitor 16 n=1 Tax=Oryctolagus cuniculus TaxID=9986 RepID=UPI0022329B09|nr:peptidase inhibitor 16 [Oryctolagus cuniculus]
MHSSCGLPALLLPPLLLLVAATGPGGALSDDEKRALVELHNLYRAQVSPPASDMLQMRWDEELAAFAKAYAQKCVWGHNKERGRRGENLFAITDEVVDVPLAMEEWHHEREHYNLSAATCARDQMCGHYTQVVWSKSERIGCGSHFCEKLQGVEETNIQLLVCNYEPPGNVKGKRPYQEGPPCSQCPSGYRCEDSLCEPIRGPEEAQDLPDSVTEAASSPATGASGAGKTGTPSPAAEVAGSPATEALPVAHTKAPSSLATTTTQAAPTIATKVPHFPATHSLPSLEEGPVTFPGTTQAPSPQSMHAVASDTSTPSLSPQSSPYPSVSLTGTSKPLPQAQDEAEPEAQSPPSREVLASVSPAQDKPGELQATLDHSGHTSSKSLSSVPNASVIANATGGRTLALQASLPGAQGPEEPGMEMSWGHVWGPLQPLLLLPLLVLAVIF